MANLSAIKLPNGTTYSLKDNGALQLTGGQVTGPVSFGDSVTMDEVTTGDLVVNGSASFTNNIQANTINGVEVGTNPKFTDTNTVTTVSTSGSGNAVTSITASNGALTVTKGTTFLTSHQDISGKADKSATVSTVAYDSTNKKITKTINGTTSDVVTVATLKTALGSMPASDVYSWAKASSKPTYTASEVGALASNTTYVSTITTTAGAHSTISSKSGAVSFNIPTTAAHVNAIPYLGVLTSLGSSTPAAATQTYWVDNIPNNSVSIAYNTSGNEYSLIFSRGGSASYGSVLKWGYTDLYFYIMRKNNSSSWRETDWVKMNAGYADSAGSVAWSNVSSKPTATGSKVTGITASTTATKTTLGTAFTIPNVTSAGSASTWAFEDIACDDITGWSAGSGSASISGAVDSNDSSQLNITISHTHTAPTLNYTARTVSSKKSGANGSAPTLGTAFTVPNVTGNTSATVSVTDPGHTHSI